MRRLWTTALTATMAVSMIGLAGTAHAQDVAAPRVLDTFDDLTSWQVVTADGVSLNVFADVGRDGTGKSARLEYDFSRGSGYAIIRKHVDLPLRENYAFSYFVRGEGPRNTMEFKLIDPSGDNVWWVNRRDFEWPAEWTRVTLPRRKIGFAWGPAGPGTPLKQVGFIEIVVTSSSGGKGTVWLDDLAFEPLPEVRPYTGTPTLTVPRDERTTVRIGSDGVVDWQSDIADVAPTPRIDFGQAREIGGLVLTWGAGAPADYDVMLSTDGLGWSLGAQVRGSHGSSNFVQLSDATARMIEIRCASRPDSLPLTLRSVRFMPPEFGDSMNAVLEEAARSSPRGQWPRAMRGEAVYWTVVGSDGDANEALISEDGAVEVNKLGFTIEPFLFERGSMRHGALSTWADGTTRQDLEDGCLPIPSVTRTHRNIELRVTAFADGPPGRSRLALRYRVTNLDTEPRTPLLYLAVRPMQVNPPYQNLNITGGAAPVRRIAFDDALTVSVDDRRIILLEHPAKFGAGPFDGGEVVSHLADGLLPDASQVSDPRSMASGALRYDVPLEAKESRDFWIMAPFHDQPDGMPDPEGALHSIRSYWMERLGRVTIRLPKGQERIAESVRANLAYILINRDGPGLQPGSRCYERTWIRDGALTSSALLAMGLHDEVRDFLDWFAPFQYDNGKVPCCVDKRGPDPVAEHDSHGEYIAAVRTCFDFTGDSDFLRRHWPRVRKATEYIEFLRGQRMTDEFAKGPEEKRVLYGLMPESISHEGYSAKPMHSYWDDFWTLKGLRDAAYIAGLVGERGDHERLDSLARDFQRTLSASIDLAVRLKKINYVPGCAELGDFDATSTTVAMFPCEWEAGDLRPVLDATFDRYWTFFKQRRDGTLSWKDYTPYEHRVVGSMVMLGHRERALEMLDFFFKDQRPLGWKQWAEVVRKDPREPGYIGDMPHTWCGSDFINSVRTMFAFRRERDDALVLVAGLPREWLEDAQGVEVNGLRTEWGPLRLNAHGDSGRVRIHVEGLERSPSGGVWLSLPDAGHLGMVRADGRALQSPATAEPGHPGLVRLRSLPADVEVEYTK